MAKTKDKDLPPLDDPSWQEIEGEFDPAWLTPEGWKDEEGDDAEE